MKKVLSVIVLILIIIFIWIKPTPIPGYNYQTIESCSSANGNIDPKYFDELKSRFIESGLSEEYFNKNIRLISARPNDRGQIDFYYLLKTNSWIDTYLPKKCGQAGALIHGWINTKFGDGNTGITAYSIESKIWNNEKVVSENTQFKEITKVMSPWKASILAKTCAPFFSNKYSIYLTPKLTFEYVVNGKDFSTVADGKYHMQTRVDLVTGEVKCQKANSIFY